MRSRGKTFVPDQLALVKQLADDRSMHFPGQGQMKPEQLEIARLKREVAKLKAERAFLKKARLTSRRNRREVRFYASTRFGQRSGCAGARCLARYSMPG